MKSSLGLFTAALLGLVSGIEGLEIRATKSGCDAPLPSGITPGKSVNLTLESSSGVSPRKYRLHLPPGYDGSKKLPLILSFHGRTQDALYQEELSQFSNASYGFEGISVYPQGVPLINKVRYSIHTPTNKS
jgi:poly(3-hydroxybutyrate) depolymerase